MLPKAGRRRNTNGLENISTGNWFKFSSTKCKVLHLGNNNKNFCWKLAIHFDRRQISVSQMLQALMHRDVSEPLAMLQL